MSNIEVRSVELYMLRWVPDIIFAVSTLSLLPQSRTQALGRCQVRFSLFEWHKVVVVVGSWRIGWVCGCGWPDARGSTRHLGVCFPHRWRSHFVVVVEAGDRVVVAAAHATKEALLLPHHRHACLATHQASTKVKHFASELGLCKV